MRMIKARIAAAISAAFMVTACVTTAGDGSTTRVFDFGGYTVTTERLGCSVNSAKIVNKGMTIPFHTTHTLTIAARGTTSAVYMLICDPVMAGGNASCNVIVADNIIAAESAGLGCGGWDQYNMVRN